MSLHDSVFLECPDSAAARFECLLDELFTTSLFQSFRKDLGFHFSWDAADTIDIPK
jgi:hypothetical protein